MPDQLAFNLDPAAGHGSTDEVAPQLRDEVGRAWGLPLGQLAEISFRRGNLPAISGRLELLSTPDFPWDPHAPLQLRIAGFTFNSRDIDRWTRL